MSQYTAKVREVQLAYSAAASLFLARLQSAGQPTIMTMALLDRSRAPLLAAKKGASHDLNARNGVGEKTASWLDALRSSALAVDGDSISVGETLFTVCPWWDGPHARRGVEQMLEAAAQRRDGAWVWVYHAPPESALSWTGTRHYGDAALPELVRRHGLRRRCHEIVFKSQHTSLVGSVFLVQLQQFLSWH